MDVLVRYHRMRGRPTLWLPGVDHAGLSTQMAVRKHLESQGRSVAGFQREDWMREVEAWRAEKERYIGQQWRAHGFSLDYSRYAYTLSPEYSRAVRRAFVTLYHRGLIHRAERMVNWDPVQRTALSDLEVVPQEEEGKLWYLRYPAADDPGSAEGAALVVATTRPETLFGDVAVAVHPADERLASWIGRRVRLPLTGTEIPVVADPAVDPTFGNGALKVTPSHDPVDREIAARHPELPQDREVLDEEARLTGTFVPEALRGLSREEGRQRTVALLREKGFLEREESYRHTVGYSDRSDVPIEPRVSLQWFLDVGEMGRAARRDVENGAVRITPEYWTKTYFHFIDHLQPWCISRQVAWGHPIPVYRCPRCGSEDAYEETPARCPRCGAEGLRPDPDVLDTWFSSWLWPFATLGWPDPTDDLERYFPASVLVTGSDIVFFWVARMIMGSEALLGRPPFPHVYLTGILRDHDGRKLSKHLGNSPDPLELIERWGADAFRVGLLFPLPTEEGGAWEPEKASEGGRNFLTKVWNLVRMLEGYLPAGLPPPSEGFLPPQDAPLLDRWIISRYHGLLEDLPRRLDAYEFTPGVGELYQFLWHELADWWAEAAKPRLSGREGESSRRQACATGLYVIEGSLRALHPFAPHITEELWQTLPHSGSFLAVAPFPAPGPRSPEVERLGSALTDWVVGYRTLRSESRVPPDARPRAFLRPRTPEGRTLGGLAPELEVVRQLSRLASVEVLDEGAAPPAGALALTTGSAEFYLEPPASVVADARAALEKERAKVEEWLEKARARLSDPTFQARAPPAVVEETRGKLRELEERRRLLEEQLGGSHA
jgi:valyl-tRNA synthetase